MILISIVSLVFLMSSWSMTETQGGEKYLLMPFPSSEFHEKAVLFPDARKTSTQMRPVIMSGYNFHQPITQKSPLLALKEKIASIFSNLFNCAPGLLNGCTKNPNYFILKEEPLKQHTANQMFVARPPDNAQNSSTVSTTIKVKPIHETVFNNTSENTAKHLPEKWQPLILSKYLIIQQHAIKTDEDRHNSSLHNNEHIKQIPLPETHSPIIIHNHYHGNLSKESNTGHNPIIHGYWQVQANISVNTKETSSNTTMNPHTMKSTNTGKGNPVKHTLSSFYPAILNLKLIRIQQNNEPSGAEKTNFSQPKGIPTQQIEKPMHSSIAEMDMKENNSFIHVFPANYFNQNKFTGDFNIYLQNAKNVELSRKLPTKPFEKPLSTFADIKNEFLSNQPALPPTPSANENYWWKTHSLL